MKADPRNLQIRMVRGRAKTLVINFASWRNRALLSPTCLPPAAVPLDPIDISKWWFSMSVKNRFGVLAFTYNPITNEGDGIAGVLMWTIEDDKTELMVPGNYNFDMSAVSNPITKQPQFLCGGLYMLSDSVTDPVTVPH